MKNEKVEELSAAATEEDPPRREITIEIFEVPGRTAYVKVASSSTIFEKEREKLIGAIDAALFLVGEREVEKKPIPSVSVERIRQVLRDEQFGRTPDPDKNPDPSGPPKFMRDDLMTEEELIQDLSERHEVDYQMVKHLRERVQSVLNARMPTGDKLEPEVESEILSQGAGLGIPETTILALVEDMLEDF